ncbi:MAG: spermidine/putrescine transporter, permease protein [Verrucomicrobiota bacterium]|jgi:spermidine/putrescine transport system permease protein
MRPPQMEVHFGERLTRRQRLGRAAAGGGPGLAWLLVFFGAPLLLLLATSFLTRGEFGTVERPWTLENYRRLAGFGELGFDPVYPLLALRSVALALATTGLVLLAALPTAFFVASLPPRGRTLGLALITVPFWTSLLVRTYAWQILLSPGGWLAGAASALGWIEPGTGLYPSLGAVLACLACDYLPFMVLPLYASVEKVDWTLAEAARDLGAGRWQVFRHALLPQIRPGLVAGCLLVGLPALGQFVVPDLLGGAKVSLLGNLLQQQFQTSLDWPFGSAIAVVSLALVAAGLAWRSRSRRRQPGGPPVEDWP